MTWATGYFFGLMMGIIIGTQYYKHQIVTRKNPEAIARVEDWLRQAKEKQG